MGTTSPLLPKSWTLNSEGFKPKVGTQIVPSVALAFPFEETGILVVFAASMAQTAAVVSSNARYYVQMKKITKVAHS